MLRFNLTGCALNCEPKCNQHTEASSLKKQAWLHHATALLGACPARHPRPVAHEALPSHSNTDVNANSPIDALVHSRLALAPTGVLAWNTHRSVRASTAAHSPVSLHFPAYPPTNYHRAHTINPPQPNKDYVDTLAAVPARFARTAWFNAAWRETAAHVTTGHAFASRTAAAAAPLA